MAGLLSRRFVISLVGVVALLSADSAVRAVEKPAPTGGGMTAAMREHVDASLGRGLEFLAATQREDGSWEFRGRPDPAITSLAGASFAKDYRYGPDHRVTQKALAFVLSHRKDDGGIYLENLGLNNYYTSVALMFLAAIGGDTHADTIKGAQAYLKGEQWDESEDIGTDNAWYGGAGYGRGKRPDLSNTQMMLEALKQSGLSSDDPVFQKAKKFVERCQMSSGSNDQMFSRGASDGGFVYSPANDGESKAGTVETRDRPMLRTYGSMTYSGFKSLLYADVKRDDPRVQAALQWIKKHWTLDANPNMPEKQSREGLYYYYNVFARAMRAWGEPVIRDDHDRNHNWRIELSEQLMKRQRPDGSWVNDTASRWGEDNPYLVTAYATLSMHEVLGE